jgi:hypothetical protein
MRIKNVSQHEYMNKVRIAVSVRTAPFIMLLASFLRTSSI